MTDAAALSDSQREQVLQQQVVNYVKKGWIVTSQTQTSATLTKKKKFSFWMFVLFLGIFYLPYYMAKRDKTLMIQVDQSGRVNTTG